MEPIRARPLKKLALQPQARVRTTKASTAKPAPLGRPVVKRVSAVPEAGRPKRITTTPEKSLPPKSNTRRKEYIALGITGIILLIVSSVLAVTGSLGETERQVFALINHAYLPNWVAEQAAKPISNAVWGIIFLVVVLLAVPRYRLLAWQYAVAAGSTYVVTFIIEHLVDRARPIGLEGYDAVLRATQDGPGFPSGHVAVLTALVLTVWPFVAWPWRVVLVLFVAAEAWSRVFLGVHAPLDVIGGLAVAAVVVATIHLLPTRIRKIFKIAA